MADATAVDLRSNTLEGALWDALETGGVGFLGLTKSGLHPQPVVAFVERRRRRLWLAALADSELVRSIGEGGAAMYTAHGAGLMAAVGGALSLEEDTRRLPRLWNAQAQAWRPQGPYDPGLCLLRLDCVDAEVTLADVGMMRFSWDLGRALLRPGRAAMISPEQRTLH